MNDIKISKVVLNKLHAMFEALDLGENEADLGRAKSVKLALTLVSDVELKWYFRSVRKYSPSKTDRIFAMSRVFEAFPDERLWKRIGWEGIKIVADIKKPTDRKRACGEIMKRSALRDVLGEDGVREVCAPFASEPTRAPRSGQRGPTPFTIATVLRAELIRLIENHPELEPELSEQAREILAATAEPVAV